jgi:uncharacterized RDD family membrane protein YckC
MRCPKCRYISFDASDRCRNCGYEFALTVDIKALDLPIQTGEEPEGPLAEFSLTDLDRLPPPEPARKPATAGLDLPLFTDRRGGEDAPLVTPPAVPRAPLAVRKSTPAVARPPQRPRIEEPELDLGLPEEKTAPPVRAAAPAQTAPGDDTRPVTAPIVRRLGAAVIDMFILGSIDAAVLYFTMRLCGLQLFEIGMIPVVPFASFILMQNVGYLVAFVAAGGQTIGKMAFDIKVVPAQAADAWIDRVPLGAALVRAIGWTISVFAVGLGLLPALFSAERRTLHDRLADTRVVRA